MAAFTGSQPGALLSVKYQDIDLFILQDPKTGENKLMLQLQLENTKSRQKCKRPNTYTFNVDSNPMFCVISHLIALAHDDEAYAAPNLTSPERVFDLRVKPGLGCQPITWGKGKLNTPVFRSSFKT
ncbi:MAG: hypothetical protein M1812_005834 [Candelaria pacifica]|nr:MAG: hypothetical protein M1812_005834 [Candelaria pacifica]